MLSKYLIGFLGVGTVAGGVTATTIALSSNQDPVDNKKNSERPKKQLTGDQKSKGQVPDSKSQDADSSKPEGQQQRK